jgi:hypothetical protein
MLDGPDYPSSSTKSRYDELLTENERLKGLLLENGISWVPQKPKEPVKVHKMKTRKSSATSEKQLPHLPMEIQLRILGFTMRCSFSITDPFFRPRNEHLTKDERAKRKEIPVRKSSLRIAEPFAIHPSTRIHQTVSGSRVRNRSSQVNDS